MPINQKRCLNCDTPLVGKFCHLCGQKEIEPKERTIKYLFFQFLGAAFFLENNLLKNITTLLLKPGKITRDYIEGKHKRWIPPLSIFLLLNLVYFFYNPLSDLSLSLSEQFSQPVYGEYAKAIVEKNLQNENLTLNKYAESYNQRSINLSKIFIILNVPLLCLMISGLYTRKKLFFADHFVYALNLFSFVLLIVLLISLALGIIAFIYRLINEPVRLNAGYFSFFLLIGAYTYVLYSVRKVYQQNWGLTMFKSVLIIFFFILTNLIYRSFLFFITFFTS